MKKFLDGIKYKDDDLDLEPIGDCIDFFGEEPDYD